MAGKVPVTFADGDQSWQTLPVLIAARAARTPDHVVFGHLGRGDAPVQQMTCAGLHGQARAVAAALQGRLVPGDRVMLVFLNEPDFIAIALGCIMAGLIVVPAAAPRNARTLTRLLDLSTTAGAGLIVVSDQLRGIVTKLRAAAVAAGDTTDQEYDWLFAGDILSDTGSPAFVPPPVGPDTIAVLQFTSGSTGNQKGVMVSHANIIHNCRMLQSVCGAGPGMRMVAWLPFFHDWGLIGCMMFPLHSGGTSFYFDPADFLRRPRRWIEAISEHRATVSCAPNFAYHLATATATEPGGLPLDLSDWHLAMIGAEPVRRDTIEAFATAFAPWGFRRTALFPSYGLAENTLIVSGGTPGTGPVYGRSDDGQAGGARLWVGCGKPLLDQRLRIVDPETGQPCPDRRIGEVWLAGPSVTGGYWQRPDATETAFHAQPAPAAGADEDSAHWLRSGDLGFLADGELFICGRLKDVIIKSGVNHLAEDLEHAMGRADPGLRPGCGAAFSVDAGGMERLVLVHEVNFGKKPDPVQLIGKIQRAVSEDHAVMADAIAILPPGKLEKTSSGKIRRQHSRTLFLADQLDPLFLWKSW
jgi:acyl-CoA synthetase (AMP-forming)/AMP-acid ligase II